MAHIHDSNAKRRVYERKHHVRKAVVEFNEADISDMWSYRFQAKHILANDRLCVLASDSLSNLKQAIKERRWSDA